jgi:uncharacterized OB-fold protein
MTAASDELIVSRCGACHARFMPRLGPCPRCGSLTIFPHPIPPDGLVLAATELTTPAAGWTAPHRLALVELAESVRLLTIVVGELPANGSAVRVVRDGDRYLAEAPAAME